MGWFGKKFKKKNTLDIQVRVQDEHKRCTICNRLLSEYTKKEFCHSCEEQRMD
jgi:uncharacterized protein with PIN domain